MFKTIGLCKQIGEIIEAVHTSLDLIIIQQFVLQVASNNLSFWTQSSYFVNKTINCCHGAAGLQGTGGQHGHSRDDSELSCWLPSLLRVCDEEVHRLRVSNDLPGGSPDDLRLVLLRRAQKWSLNTTRQWSGIREGLGNIYILKSSSI